MSENSTPEQRTEMPTERRMSQLRDKGQLHYSAEVVQVGGLMMGFLVLSSMWGWLYHDLMLVFSTSFSMIADSEPLSVQQVRDGGLRLALLIGPALLTIMGSIALVASFAMLIQTNFNVKKKWIEFQWHMLNPMNGLKRIVSVQGVVNVAKALLKLAIILPLSYFAIKGFAPQMVRLVHLGIQDILRFVGEGISYLFWRILYIMIAMAIVDWVWGKFRWLHTNKMTKDEVKDERKSVEGDEETKRKIINKGLQRIMLRIKQSVRKADVVVTNPTHYAVALRYERSAMRAPKVVAKGADHMALRIREIAKEAGVPVLERKALARALYHSTEVGAEIPYDLFKAVAEVLAFVYRMKGGSRSRSSSSAGARV